MSNIHDDVMSDIKVLRVIASCSHCDEEDELFTLICGQKVCVFCRDYSGAELLQKICEQADAILEGEG